MPRRKNLSYCTSEEIADIKVIATQLREEVVKMVQNAGSGHVAGALGMADVFAALYFHVLYENPANPKDPNRDRVILSNGHICPILYATLAKKGH